MHFKDRFQAGRFLAAKLNPYQARKDVVILALPRGGVEVGYEVAVALQAPLDVLVVRKVGLPGFPEMAVGALASGNIENISRETVERFQVSLSELQRVIVEERKELRRQEQFFRDDRPFPSIDNKVVILVDDGLATGHTMKAAIDSLRNHAPKEIVVAIPVGASDTYRLMTEGVNQVVCLLTPTDFVAVGGYYENFRQVDDDEVLMLLQKASENLPEHAQDSSHFAHETEKSTCDLPE
jgi:putative phosphoribosyl transferase